jgi:hypothetical protein
MNGSSEAELKPVLLAAIGRGAYASEAEAPRAGCGPHPLPADATLSKDSLWR